MPPKQPRGRKSEPSFHASRIEKLARKAGYTVEKLHALWAAGKRGDVASDNRIQSLSAKYPAIAEVFEIFVRGDDPRQRGGLRRELISNKPKKKPETFWSAAKPKWVSVVAGGLPTLGKRR